MSGTLGILKEVSELWPIITFLMASVGGYLFLQFRVRQLEIDSAEKATKDAEDFKGLSIKINNVNSDILQRLDKLRETVNENHIRTTSTLSRIEGSLNPHRATERTGN